MIRVVVVDDEPMVCAHLRTILGSSGDIEVVDQAHDGAAGVEAVVRSRPDLVLMDLRMPGVDGLAAIERIGKLADPPVVVVLTTFDADQYVLRALRAGAAGFLVKSTPPADLIGLVRVAADGHTVLSPAAARRLIAASTDSQRAREHARELVGTLTEREAEVLGGLGQGLSNAQISAGCTCRRPRSRDTCRACSSSSAAPTGPRPGCSRTTPGSCGSSDSGRAGWAEPAHERFSQRWGGGARGFAGGRGPGDMGVRADEQGVGWRVIRLSGADVDAMPPVPGRLAQVRAVGEVEEDGPGGVHEFRDAGGALAGVQGEVGCEGAGQGMLAEAGHGVANAGAGDERSEAALRLIVGEQLGEEFPECLGGWVLPAPQCHLGLGLQQGPGAGEVALAVVGVQQAGRARPAMTAASFQARLTASSRPKLMPMPVAGN